MDTSADKATCERSLHAMATGTLDDLAAVYTADARNRESAEEPPDTRTGGPAALFATAVWLRTAFSDLRWDVHAAVQDGDLVVLHTSMSGRQTGPFSAWGPQGDLAVVLPPTGRSFSVTQTHWFRMVDGRIAEHWANRDDRGMGEQLGWTPPRPPYLARMLLATRRARAQLRR